MPKVKTESGTKLIVVLDICEALGTPSDIIEPPKDAGAQSAATAIKDLLTHYFVIGARPDSLFCSSST